MNKMKQDDLPFPSIPKKDTSSVANNLLLQSQKNNKRQPADPFPEKLPPYLDIADGHHPLQQFMDLFSSNHGMTSQQVKAIYYTVDKNKSGTADDREWMSFYETFIIPYNACVPNANQVIEKAALETCLADPTLSKLDAFSGLDPAVVGEIMGYFDQSEEINLFNYLFLRRVNNGLKSCGDIGGLQPSKIYCFLMIATPRASAITATDESSFFKAAMILTHGMYIGQSSFLTLNQVIAFSSIFNFFSDYEIPFKDGIIDSAMFLRAAQDGYLPGVYNAFIVKQFFQEMKEMDFYSLAISIKAFRMYIKDYGTPPPTVQYEIPGVGQTSMNLDKFLAAYKTLPPIAISLIDSSYVPTQEEIEVASRQLNGKGHNAEDSFLKNLNNLVFLQKSQKKTFKKKSPTFDILKTLKEVTYDQGANIFFNMMNSQTNGFIDFGTWLRFIRITQFYIEVDSEARQFITFEQTRERQIYSSLSCFSQDDVKGYFMIEDYLNKNFDFFLNYKEFMSFFFIKRVFKMLTSASNTKYTGAQLLIAGFKQLGTRLSGDDIALAQNGFSSRINQDSENIAIAFKRAIQEECLVNQMKLPKKIAMNIMPDQAQNFGMNK